MHLIVFTSCYNGYFCGLEVSKEVITYVNTEVNS